MDILLNGQPHHLDTALTLQQLVASLALSGKAIAVAVNRRVVPSTAWDTTTINDKDNVDVVRAIGGG